MKSINSLILSNWECESRARLIKAHFIVRTGKRKICQGCINAHEFIERDGVRIAKPEFTL